MMLLIVSPVRMNGVADGMVLFTKGHPRNDEFLRQGSKEYVVLSHLWLCDELFLSHCALQMQSKQAGRTNIKNSLGT